MSITLHPEKGVNPHMCFCPQCGDETNELILMGIRGFVCVCEHCGANNYGEGVKCMSCGASLRNVKRRVLDESERVPGSLCKKCEEENKMMAQEVAAGGVYLHCKDCGMRGVTKAGSPVAVKVRAHTGIISPAPVGLEITKNECPVCGENKEG